MEVGVGVEMSAKTAALSERLVEEFKTVHVVCRHRGSGSRSLLNDRDSYYEVAEG